jgi:excisionase family DNA binding protein
LPADLLAEIEERVIARVIQRLGQKPTREQWFTDRQVAELVSVHRRTVQRWRRSHGLPYSFVGGTARTKASDLEAWLDQKKMI